MPPPTRTPGGDHPVDPVHRILDGARAGEPWAHRRLWHTYAPAVAGYLRSQGSDDPDGLTNDVFLAGFRHLGNFRGGEPELRSWLFTIAHNRLIDERRRRSRSPQLESLDARFEQAGEPGSDDGERAAIDRDGTARVVAVLDRLAPDQRDVLLLRIVGDLTIDQISEVVRKRPGAVKALQRRGLATIRRMFEREGVSL